jgi:hypothetical protein
VFPLCLKIDLYSRLDGYVDKLHVDYVLLVEEDKALFVINASHSQLIKDSI